MKQFIVCLTCLLLYSCDPEWAFIPPHQGMWIIQNNTDEDLILHLDLVCLNEWNAECDVFVKYELLSNSEVDEMRGGRYSDDVYFDLFLCQGFEKLVSGSIYITPKDGVEVVKEWVYGVDNGSHDIFNESEWDYREWDSDNEASTFTVFHREWTFTITDADIGFAE